MKSLKHMTIEFQRRSFHPIQHGTGRPHDNGMRLYLILALKDNLCSSGKKIVYLTYIHPPHPPKDIC